MKFFGIRMREPSVIDFEPSLDSLPVESEGRCSNCRRKGTLGDGLCVRCWDGRTYKNQEQARNEDIVDDFADGLGYTPMELSLRYGLSLRTIQRVLHNYE